MIMLKNKKYEHPELRLIDLASEGLLCTSFTGAIGAQGEGGAQLPGFEEEKFQW
jgi:hypothetical protein